MTTCNKPVAVDNQDFPCQREAGHTGGCIATPGADAEAGRPITRTTTDLELYITDDEIEMLKACRTEADWKSACLLIKESRQNHYPRDWYARVILSGLMKQITAQFAAAPTITVTSTTTEGGITQFTIPVGPQDDDKEPDQ